MPDTTLQVASGSNQRLRLSRLPAVKGGCCVLSAVGAGHSDQMPFTAAGLDRVDNEIVRIHVPETGAAQVQAIQVFQGEPVRHPVRFRAAVLDHDALAAPGVNRVDRAKPSVWQTARTDAFDAVRQVVFIQTDELLTVACVAP